jgi:ComF family protein
MSLAQRPKTALGTFFATTLDLILPPRCIGTGDIVDAPGMISPGFWSQLQFIEKPFCACCGLAFNFDMAEDALCAECLDDMPDFDAARAAVIYNDASRKAVLDFKYGDKLHAVKTFLPWLMRAGGELLTNSDVILPIPLHPRRLWQRRFNQSALLAEDIARITQKTYLPEGLVRERFTSPQKGLSRQERNDNVKNAFAVHPAYSAQMKGKNLLLIDDVFTSGATLNECARILKKAGAAKVFVLTIARVTRDEFQ